jgi:hypothetical protein
MRQQLLQEIAASGTVSEEFKYDPNTFTPNDEGKCLAFVSNIDKHTHCVYMQPEDDIQSMEKLTEELEYAILTENSFTNFKFEFVVLLAFTILTQYQKSC